MRTTGVTISGRSFEEPHTWWRDPCDTFVVLRLANAACMRDLAAAAGGMRPHARALAAVAEREKTAGSAPHGVRPPPADNFVTDLLGSALLIEAAAGHAKARLLVDHLRRQRGLAALSWQAERLPAARREPGPRISAVESAAP